MGAKPAVRSRAGAAAGPCPGGPYGVPASRIVAGCPASRKARARVAVARGLEAAGDPGKEVAAFPPGARAGWSGCGLAHLRVMAPRSPLPLGHLGGGLLGSSAQRGLLAFPNTQVFWSGCPSFGAAGWQAAAGCAPGPVFSFS